MMDGPTSAIHGGAFWAALDSSFQCHRPSVVCADVLDAWFAPPSELMEEFAADLPFLIRTSPPTHAEGMRRAIAEARGLPPECVTAAGGSSALIHTILKMVLRSIGRVCLLEPTYSEYRFVAERIVGAQCESFNLFASDGFSFSEESWRSWIRQMRPNVAVLVQPNNPTGTRMDVARLLDGFPRDCTLIVDEAYIDYTKVVSSERLAADRTGLVVIKSLSKAYGLSGLRAAYAVAHPDTTRILREITPPWAVSGPAQWWGCRIWEWGAYYADRWAETIQLRRSLVEGLEALPGRLLADEANWALWEHGLAIGMAEVLQRLSAAGVFVRDASATGPSLSPATLRISVRPPEENERVLRALAAL